MLGWHCPKGSLSYSNDSQRMSEQCAACAECECSSCQLCSDNCKRDQHGHCECNDHLSCEHSQLACTREQCRICEWLMQDKHLWRRKHQEQLYHYQSKHCIHRTRLWPSSGQMWNTSDPFTCQHRHTTEDSLNVVCHKRNNTNNAVHRLKAVSHSNASAWYISSSQCNSVVLFHKCRLYVVSKTVKKYLEHFKAHLRWTSIAENVLSRDTSFEIFKYLWHFKSHIRL